MLVHDHPIASSVLVGREDELSQLTQALNSVQRGNGQCLFIAGESGIGKSRLLSELRLRATEAQLTILEGHCFEQDVSFPYAPWIDALRTMLAPRSLDEICDLLGPLSAEFLKLLPELAPIIENTPTTPALDSEIDKRRLFEAFSRLGARLSQSRRLLVIIEDLHWSDETSLDLFHFLARRIAHQPILLIATYRDDEIPSCVARFLVQMNRERLAQEITLHPLSPEEVSEMVQVIFHLDNPIKSDFIDFLVPLAEGNPFFVEEILKSLVAAGDIYYAGGQWERKAAGELHIPPGIREAVLQSVEPLTAETRRLLTWAAVAGHRFNVALLKELSDMNETELVERLKQLVAAHIVVEESADQFAFRHALTREAVYGTLLVRERRALHQRIGERMERLYADAGERQAHSGELAYHFYQAERWEQALEYAQVAGERARGLYALPEALTQFTRALDAAQKLGRTPPLELLSARGKVHETLGNFDQALADYEPVLEHARGNQNRRVEWQMLLALGFLWVTRDYERAGGYFREALALARTLGDPAALGHTLNRIGNWHLNLDEPFQARQYHREALDIFEELNDPRGLAETYELLGISTYNCGDAIEGVTYCERAEGLCRELDDRQGLLHAITHQLLPELFEEEITFPVGMARILGTTESARDMAREMGWRAGEAQALQIMTEALLTHGEYGRGLSAGQMAMAIARDIGHRAGVGMSSWILGHLYLDIFALPEAQREMEAGMTAAQESGSIMFLRLLIPALASVRILQKDFTGAEALLDRLPHEEIRNQTRHLRLCWRVRAELELARGNADKALAIADELIASTVNVDEYGPHAVARLCFLRGQALAALGRPQEAEAELRSALNAARQHEYDPLVWRIHAACGKLYLSLGQKEKAEHEFSAARVVIQELAIKIPDDGLRENFVQSASAMLPTVPVVSPRQAARQEFGGLTPREREVARLIAQGKSNREVASALVLSERTVEKHVANILAKLDFVSRAQIAAWAAEKGLVGPGAQ